jgi:hypothetical protein
MLSKYDLMNNPEIVQPLGSRKGVLNKPCNINLDIDRLFIAKDNVNLLVHNLYNIYQQNGGKGSKQKFRDLIPKLMNKFIHENDLSGYEAAEAQATGINNYVTVLKTINNDFMSECYKYFRWNSYNPFQDNVEVGPVESRVLKKSYELTADDHGTLDLWREQFTQVLNRNFRNNNKIPVYRTGIHTRHYDRSNEGLLFNNPDRASLETPVRGYDMSQIHKSIDRYKSEEWYGM